MGINWSWNWRLTILKAIKIMLIRPLMINLKMTVSANCAVSAHSPIPLSIKTLAHCLSVRGNPSLDRNLPSPLFSLLLGSKMKQTFLSIILASLLASDGEQLDPSFGYIFSLNSQEQVHLDSWVITSICFQSINTLWSIWERVEEII